MFPKKNRLDKKEVERIFKEGRFVNSPNLTLKYILFLKGPRKISFITPKTISKKAVIRNLLRRRGFFVLKKHINDFPVRLGGTFIFGKKSVNIFGGKKDNIHNPLLNLENEIRVILKKL